MTPRARHAEIPRKTVPVVLAAITALLLGACRQPQAESQTARVDKLFAEWNKKDAPGCAVGISRTGAIVYQHGYGMANIELNVPITPETVFAVASVTKSFTAMSVLLAAERGQLSLDDEVHKYIPDWQDREDHITIRHLITHTSGIRDAFALLGWAAPSANSGDTNEAVVKMLSRQRGLNFPPGTEYQYNNGGYNLLASILKRATGQSLREFADANIFKPLGMAHTQVHDDATMLVSNRASGYTRNPKGWVAAKEFGTEAGISIGNDGMYSTVGDLLLWEDNFETHRVGTPELLAAMQTPTVLKDGTTHSGGVGLGLSQYRGLSSFEGSGGSWGVASKFARFPKQHLSIAVLCNEDNVVMGGMARVNPDVFTNGIADIYLTDALAPADVAPSPAPVQVPVKLADAELAEKTGLYRIGGVDVPVLLAVNHGTLMLRSYYGDDFDFELTPVSANRFLLANRMPPLLFEFIPATAGGPKEWHVGEGKDQRVWQLVSSTATPAEVQSYAGDYRSDELGITYTLQAKASTLVVANTVTIVPFSKDVFVGDWVGIVKFSRDARGAVTGFTVNRANARGVRFDRVKRTG